jgi:phage N-6-adenine-methyltransferase
MYTELVESDSMTSPYEASTGFYSSRTAMSSLDDTWSTPYDFYVKVDREFDFGLDAAALQSSTLVAMNWYGPDHQDTTRTDAFVRDWTADAAGKAIWLNPPYGRTIKEWMRKADEESKKGSTVVCLVPSRTDTAWFHEYCLHHEVRFIRGRLKFGKAANPAPFPSALVVMRPKAL